MAYRPLSSKRCINCVGTYLDKTVKTQRNIFSVYRKHLILWSRRSVCFSHQIFSTNGTLKLSQWVFSHNFAMSFQTWGLRYPSNCLLIKQDDIIFSVFKTVHNKFFIRNKKKLASCEFRGNISINKLLKERR